jgi:hypothetical protein
MEIEYEAGQRVTPLPHEMSPLNVMIQRFETQAKDYYQKKASLKKETGKERIKREKELAAVLKHLKNERKTAAAFAQVQTRLAEYQGWGRKMSDENPWDLLEEKHHPTKVLARNMRTDGWPQPSKRHSPHHIVQGKGKHPLTADTRLNLHLYGIRINDPDNGVWMPRTKKDKGHWSMPNAAAHSEIHTFNYETWVNFLIGSLEGETAIRSALVRVRLIMRNGTQPKQVTAEKDPKWKPKL